MAMTHADALVDERLDHSVRALVRREGVIRNVRRGWSAGLPRTWSATTTS